MVRPFRQQADEVIVDHAASLFARRGVAKTSVQDVATAVGLSKAGLLHHFPTKDALRDAVLARARELGRQVLDEVQDLPVGPVRDRRAVEAIVDLALAHPGMVALLLTPLTQGPDADADDLESAGAVALDAFGVPAEPSGSERTVRVVGALAAVAVLAVAGNRHDLTTAWRQHIVATCCDALGHHRAGAPRTPLDQVEA